MKLARNRCVLLLLTFAVCSAAQAQTFPTPDYFQRFFRYPHVMTQLPGPRSLDEYVVDGKLRLSLDDAIRLMLLNNTEVRISQAQSEQSGFGITRAYSAFDPIFTANFLPQRSTQPTTSSLQGATTLSQLNQQANFNYSQLFQSGTSFAVGFAADRLTTNSTFATFNPSFVSGAT